MNVSWSVTGKAELQKKLARAPAEVRQRLGKVLYQHGEYIMGLAKELCPVDTGALRGSGHTVLEVEGSVILVRLAFGGPAAPYAVVVHENLEVHHPVGQAKFLEVPFNAHKNRIREALAEVLDSGHKGA